MQGDAFYQRWLDGKGTIPRITQFHDGARSLQGASIQEAWGAHDPVEPVTGTPAVPREVTWCMITIMMTTWDSCTAVRKTAPMSMRAVLQAKKRHDSLQQDRGTVLLSVVTIVQKTVLDIQSRESKYHCLGHHNHHSSISIFIRGLIVFNLGVHSLFHMSWSEIPVLN